MAQSHQAYPLQWPEGRPRTLAYKRKVSRFKTSFAKARDNLISELQRLGSKLPVLSTNIELRLDGIPYASRRQPDDPGVAVYFQYEGIQMCFACDKYHKVEENIHAIMLTIDALRGIKRWGTGDMMKRAFSGFTALPHNPVASNWRDVLQCHGINNLARIEEIYKRLRAIHHPDRGGDKEKFQQVQAAYEQARQELYET